MSARTTAYTGKSYAGTSNTGYTFQGTSSPNCASIFRLYCTIIILIVCTPSGYRGAAFNIRDLSSIVDDDAYPLETHKNWLEDTATDCDAHCCEENVRSLVLCRLLCAYRKTVAPRLVTSDDIASMTSSTQLLKLPSNAVAQQQLADILLRLLPPTTSLENPMKNSAEIRISRRQDDRDQACQESSCPGLRGSDLRKCVYSKCRGRRKRPLVFYHLLQQPNFSDLKDIDLDEDENAEQQPAKFAIDEDIALLARLQRQRRAWIDYTSNCHRLSCSTVRRRDNRVVRVCEQQDCNDYF